MKEFHKLPKVHLNPGDTLHLSYTDKHGVRFNEKVFNFDKSTVVDTCIVDTDIPINELAANGLVSGIKIILGQSTGH